MESQEFSTRYQSPADYLKVFFRRKWLLLTPAFLGLVIGIIACYLLPPSYESSTVIMVEEEKVSGLLKTAAVAAPEAVLG